MAKKGGRRYIAWADMRDANYAAYKLNGHHQIVRLKEQCQARGKTAWSDQNHEPWATNFWRTN